MLTPLGAVKTLFIVSSFKVRSLVDFMLINTLISISSSIYLTSFVCPILFGEPVGIFEKACVQGFTLDFFQTKGWFG